MELQEIADEVVPVRGAKSLGVPSHALPVCGEAVLSLVRAGKNRCQQEGPRIHRALEEELKLLPGTQRNCLSIGGGKGCHHRPNPLVLFLLQLLLRFFPLLFRRKRGRFAGSG
jgi:hypothetical protein